MKKMLLVFLVFLSIIISGCNDKKFSDEGGIGDENQNGESQPGENGGITLPVGEMKLKNYSEFYIKNKYFKDSLFKNKLETIGEYENNINTSIVPNALYASANGTGDGKSKNDPANIYDAVDSLKPGGTLYLLGGDYIMGETLYISIKADKIDPSKYTTIRNYPGESVNITSNEKNIADFAENHEYGLFSIEKTAANLVIEGLTFSNIIDNNTYGISMWDGGQKNIIIRDNDFNNLKTTNGANEEYGANAILMMGESMTPTSNVVIYNNYVHDNVIGYSEAISVAGNCEYVYVFNNRLKNNTNISIDFYGNNRDYCSTPSLNQPRYCIAAGNVVSESNSVYADCAGIYVDGAKDILVSNNIVYNSQYGIEIGSEERNDDYPVINIDVFNNIIYNNQYCGIRIGGFEIGNTGVVKNVNVYNNTLVNNNTSNSGAEFIINMVDGINIKNNVIKTKYEIISTEDFTAKEIKNLVVKNNAFDTLLDECVIYLEKEYTFEAFNSLSDNFSNKKTSLSFNDKYEVSGDVMSTEKLIDYDFNYKKRENNKMGAL